MNNEILTTAQVAEPVSLECTNCGCTDISKMEWFWLWDVVPPTMYDDDGNEIETDGTWRIECAECESNFYEPVYKGQKNPSN